MAPNPTRARTAVLMCAKAALAVLLLVWLAHKGWLDVEVFGRPNTFHLHVSGVLLLLAGIVPQAMRWRVLLDAQGIAIPLRTAYAVTMIGLFGSLVLPGTIGVEVIRAWYVSRHAPGRRLAVASSVLYDRLLGLYSFLLVSVAGLTWIVVSTPESRHVASRLLALVGLPVLALSVLFAAQWSDRARRLAGRVVPGRIRVSFLETLDQYARRPRVFWVALGLSILAMAPPVLAYVFASQVAVSNVSPATIAAVAPIVVVASAIPITPQGLGVAEASAALLFAAFGVGSGATIALVNRLWGVVVCLAGAIPYVFSPARRAGVPSDGDTT